MSALPPMRSWSEFLRRATVPATLATASSRREGSHGWAGASWAGASWAEALSLARHGWTTTVPSVDVAVAELRTRMADRLHTDLVRITDVAGSEVDVAAYLAGVPECMHDVEPRRMSRHGRVVTLLVPAAYSSNVDHESIMNRGRALCALCTAVVAAGHSVEVWTGYAFHIGGARLHAVAAVISAGEPFDPARLMFAVAHPAMLRRLWFGVWDGTDAELARQLIRYSYGYPPFECRRSDLPAEVTDAYVLPYLDSRDTQWADQDSALAWTAATFAELGLVQRGGGLA